MSEPGIELRWTVPGEGLPELILELYKGGPLSGKDLILLLPTSRAVTEAKRIVARNGGGLTGGIITVEALADKLYDMSGSRIPLLTRSAREMKIREIIRRDKPASFTGRGAARPGMVKRISEAVSDLMMEGLGPDKLRSASSSRREVDLAAIYEEYLGFLEGSQFLDPAGLYSYLVDNWPSVKGAVKAKRVALYMIGRQPGSVREVLSLLIRGSLEPIVYSSILDEAPVIAEGERPDIRTRVRVPEGRYGESLRTTEPLPIIIGNDRGDEMRRVCRWIKRRIMDEGLDPFDIGLILPQRERYIKHVHSIFREYSIPYDLSTDIPLRDVPSVRDVMSLVRSMVEGLRSDTLLNALSGPFFGSMPRGDQEEGKGLLNEIVTRAYILGGKGDIEGEWLAPLGVLIDEGGMEERLSTGAEWLIGILNKVVRLMDNKGTFLSFNTYLMDLLGKLDYLDRIHRVIREREERERVGPGDSSYQYLAEGASALFDVLEQGVIDARQTNAGQMDLKEWYACLRMMVEGKRIRFSPKSGGVEILGLKESIGIRKRIAVIGGLVRSEVPSFPPPFPILGERTRERLSMLPRVSRREQMLTLAFAISSHDEVILSRYRGTDGSQIEPSVFVEDIDVEEVEGTDLLMSEREVWTEIGGSLIPDLYSGKKMNIRKPLDPYLLLEFMGEGGERVRRALEGKMDIFSGPSPYWGHITDPPLLEKLERTFGEDHVWSPTQLDTYRECPYMFFVRYVLGITPIERMDPSVPADKKGTMVHSILERFYRRRLREGRPRIEKDDVESSFGEIKRICDEELSRYGYSGPYWSALRDQLVGAWGDRGILREFIEEESGYEGPFRVMDLERRFGSGEEDHEPFVIRSTSAEAPGTIMRFKGRIDRVDGSVLEGNDHYFIWDYKTGKNLPSKDSLQLPLYLAGYGEVSPDMEMAGAGYYMIGYRGKVKRHPCFGEQLLSYDGDEVSLGRQKSGISDMVQDVRMRAFEMARSIMSGDFSPKEKCSAGYCEFYDICRRRER